MKCVSLVLLGLFTAVLAGCGGGGDGGKNDMIAMLGDDLALVQADLDAAQSELATTKETLSTTQETLTTTEADLATAQADLATTKATLTTTQETLSTTEEDLVEANADLEDKEAELATTQTDLTTAESKLDTTEEQLTTTRINLATANANLTNAQTNLMTAQANLTAAETDLAEKTTELTTTQGELTTANGNLATARMELTTARADLKTAQDDLAAEIVKLATTQTDLKTAQDNLAAEKIKVASAQALLTAAQGRVTTLEGEVSTLQTEVRNLRAQLGLAQQEVADRDTEDRANEARAEANKRAFGLLRALQVEARTATVDDAGTTQIGPNGTTPPTVTIQNTPGGVRVTAGLASSSRATASPSLTVGGRRLMGTRLSRTEAGGFREEVVVYTDFLGRRVKLLDYEPFDTQVMGTMVGTRDDRYVELDTGILGMRFLEKLIVQPTSSIRLTNDPVVATAPDIADTDDKITIKNYTNPQNVTESEVDVRERPRAIAGVTLSHNTPGQSIVYKSRKGPREDNVETVIVPTLDSDIKVSFRGTVRGVAGTFSCVGGNACDFTINTQAKATSGFQALSYGLAGTWQFKPSSAATTIPVDDEEYFYFGWWQRTPNLADGAYTFRLLAGGAGFWETTNTLPTSGTARYTGSAVGKYVKRTPLDPLTFASVSEQQFSDGIFTADATLDATFTGASAASVQGTISGFKEGSTAIEGNWVVSLGAIEDPFGLAGDTGTATLTINGRAPVEDLTANDWKVWLFKDHTTPAPGNASTPRAVAGQFDVGLENDLLHISGVFGAKPAN